MKKLVILFLFTMALLLGSQSVTAQNTLEINKQANINTKALRKVVKFDSDKMQEVYEAYQSHGIAMKNLKKTAPDDQERLKKINEILDEKIKSVLSDEEYSRYLDYSDDH
ncbi:MAG: hypothetical protein WA775_07720 [Psychroserpens sp.]|uniref:hypothetical protein n=1 Tax=Psychroserpens sp. TaxID=2020870 RepID=UPI003C72C24E